MYKVGDILFYKDYPKIKYTIQYVEVCSSGDVNYFISRYDTCGLAYWISEPELLRLYEKQKEPTTMESKFWMCWIPGTKSPTYKHSYKHNAEIEAERLARELKREVFVLEATNKVECKDVVWTNLKEPTIQEIPF